MQFMCATPTARLLHTLSVVLRGAGTLVSRSDLLTKAIGLVFMLQLHNIDAAAGSTGAIFHAPDYI
jgi:hypothetical protein